MHKIFSTGTIGVVAFALWACAMERASAQAEEWYRQAIAAQTGKGGPVDLVKGKELLLKAAEANYGRAMSRLGDMYQIPDGGAPIDLAEARRWYDKAAAVNDPFGLLWSANLNDHTLSREETEKRYAKAQSVSQKVALKDPTAVFVVGMSYLNGYGVPKDAQTALEALQQVANDGEPHAMQMIADGYAGGILVTKDPQKAHEWYAKAAEAGWSTALMRLGQCYDYGRGVPRDLAQALKYYLQAAERGSPRCMTNVAQMLTAGEGAPADPVKATEFFQKAAALGWPPAMYYTGMLYETGKNVPQDHEKALYWLQKSAAWNNPQAKKYLTEHHLPLTGAAAK